MNNFIVRSIVLGMIVGGLIIGGWIYFAPEVDQEYVSDDIGFFNNEDYLPTEYYSQGPEECTQYEQYDEIEGYCYYECDTDEECLAIEAQINAELDKLEGGYADFSEGFSEFEGDSSDVLEKVQVLYAIEKGENFVVIEGEENSQHLLIKSWVAGIFPDNFSDAHLRKVGIFFDQKSDDGAFVENVESGGWEMYINGDVISEGQEEMVFTIVHEFAHILTLNDTQLNPDRNELRCGEFYTDEGCAHADAYINAFYKLFWKEKKLDDFASARYSPQEFVTDYAATNIGEDIAESFASFVLSGKKTGSTKAQQKVNFFYDYPELLQIRESIRRTLAPLVRTS